MSVLASRFSPTFASFVLLVACGDAGGESNSDSQTGPDPLSTGPSTDATGTGTATAGPDPTMTAPTTTAPTTTAPTTTAPTSFTTGSSDTGDPTAGLQCEDMPPPGFMVTPEPSCVAEPQVGQFEPVVKWHRNNWEVEPTSNRITSAPIVLDLDGDAIPDIAVVTYAPTSLTGILRVVSGSDGSPLADITDADLFFECGLAGADIDDDGTPEVLAVTSGYEVVAIDPFGGIKWTSPSLQGHIVRQNATPSVANVDGVGPPEIVVGRAILNSDGTVRGTGEYGTGAVNEADASFAVDLDEDGMLEVVVGNALYAPDGSTIWYNQQSDGRPAVADLELDGDPDIIVVAAGVVRRQSAVDGAVAWSSPVPGAGFGPPTIADFDGDGQQEIGVAGGNAYAVFEPDGTMLWSAATFDASKYTGSTVFDFEGDGAAEVVYADENTLWVFAGIDGTKRLEFTDHQSKTSMEYPLVADVDANGHADIVLVSDRIDNGLDSYSGLTVLSHKAETWIPARQIWNQHAYHITNIDDDAGVPPVADTSWKTYNTFRAAQTTLSDGLVAPDLVLVTPDSCVNTCSGNGLVAVWVQLGNIGAAPLTAGATIEVHGTKNGIESLQMLVPFAELLNAGEYAPGFSIEVETTDLESLRLVAVAHEFECKQDAGSEVVLQAPFCNVPG